MTGVHRCRAFGFAWASGAVTAQRISDLTVDKGLGMSGEDHHRRNSMEASVTDTIPAALLEIMENEAGSMS
jgi:hypothetical protein